MSLVASIIHACRRTRRNNSRTEFRLQRFCCCRRRERALECSLTQVILQHLRLNLCESRHDRDPGCREPSTKALEKGIIQKEAPTKHSGAPPPALLRHRPRPGSSEMGSTFEKAFQDLYTMQIGVCIYIYLCLSLSLSLSLSLIDR